MLALTDQPDDEALVREVYGDRVAYVPYTIPGFALAKSVADVFDNNPEVEGLVSRNMASSPWAIRREQAYGRMIEFVTLAEERLHPQRRPSGAGQAAGQVAALSEIAPILRGAVAIEKNAVAGTAKRQILDFRTNAAILNYVNGADWRVTARSVSSRPTTPSAPRTGR